MSASPAGDSRSTDRAPVKMSRLSQLLRRILQVGVVVFIIWSAFNTTWRNYKLAHNSSRLVGLIHGDLWGEAYAANESLLRRLDEDTHEASLSFLGFPWAGRMAGVDTTDPLLVLSHALSTGTLPTGSLLLSLLAPLLLALLFGKFYCSHLCPMRLAFEIGERVRRGLTRLGVPLPEIVVETRLGGWVLIGGLLGTVMAGTSVWLFILPYVGLSASIFIWITTGTTSVLVSAVALWWLVDVAFAPGYWCHNLCPTGFLLEQVGRFSLLKLRKSGNEPCPRSCNLCERECPYRLQPKEREHYPGCDACGRCVTVCPSNRLYRGPSKKAKGRALPVVGALLLAVLFPSVAAAHHNKGLPHYGYFENYPQVPTDEYVQIHGQWEIGATVFNFQGYDLRETSDTPHDVKIYLYLYNLETDTNYLGALDIEIRRGDEVVARFERQEVDEESVYSTRETLPESGEYQLVCLFGGREVSLDFFVDLNDGMDWTTLVLIGTPVVFVFLLAILGKKKTRRRRKRKRKRRKLRPAAGAIFALWHAISNVALAQIEQVEQVEQVGLGGLGEADCVSPEGLSQVITNEGPIVIMRGMPTWMFVTSIVGVLLLSFIATEFLAPRLVSAGDWRKNLIRKPKVYRWVKSRWFQAVPQTLMVVALVALTYIGLQGSRVANLTPVVVWTLWWAGLIFVVLVLGASWCFVCPWDGLANLATRLRFATKAEPLGLGLTFPKRLANLYPAILLFVLLTWVELGWGVTSNPRSTAYMGLAMAALAVMGALLFDGKRFCEHACPVGRICGLYGNFAPVEVRARNPKVCARCTTEDCLHGNDQGYACPTRISLKVVQSSTDCTFCTECVKSCDKNNVAFNLRPFGSDLRPGRVPRKDEAWLALALLALTLFHGLSMTATWESFRPGEWSYIKWMMTLGLNRPIAFTLGMVVFGGGFVLAYQLACALGAKWSRGAYTTAELFTRYSPALIPIALFYHLSHNLMHLLMEGGHVVPLLSDPMGQGDDFLGTAHARIGAFISEGALWTWQVGLILLGHVIGIVIAHRIGHGLFPRRQDAVRSLVPVFVVMVVVSVAGIGLMQLDMNMRLGRT